MVSSVAVSQGGATRPEGVVVPVPDLSQALRPPEQEPTPLAIHMRCIYGLGHGQDSGKNVWLRDSKLQENTL